METTKYVYSEAKIVGDVLFNAENKKTSIELNLGFAGKQTLFIQKDKMLIKGVETEVLALEKYLHHNGSISVVRVGALFKAVAKTGTEYYTGSFGLCSVYDKEKGKSFINKEDFGIALQMFKLEKDKWRQLNEKVSKIGFVNMQIYIADKNVTPETTAPQMPDTQLGGSTINEDEIPF